MTRKQQKEQKKRRGSYKEKVIEKNHHISNFQNSPFPRPGFITVKMSQRDASGNVIEVFEEMDILSLIDFNRTNK